MAPEELKILRIVSFFGMMILFPFFQVSWVRIIRSTHRNDQRGLALEIAVCIMYACICVFSLFKGWGSPLGGIGAAFLLVGLSTCLSVSVDALYKEKE